AVRAIRLSCLDHHLAELRAQLAVWSTADAEAVDRAPRAVGSLPDPAACASRTIGRPTTPAAHVLHDRIAEPDAARRSGRGRRVKDRLEPLTRDATQFGDDGVLA